jgi:hypothetical protein
MGGERRAYFIFRGPFVSSRWRVVYREVDMRDVDGRPLVWVLKAIPGAYEHGEEAQVQADTLNNAIEDEEENPKPL